MFTQHVMQAIMGQAMRAVLREIKWALNLQPWTAPVVHQQCVRRCIFVDHHWIIFHLITSHLLRPDDRGIKSNLTPHKSLPYDQTHLSSQPVSKSNCQILSTRVPWWENQWQRRWEEMVNVRRNRRNCPTKKSSLRRSRVPAAAITRWEQRSNLRSLMISAAATESQEINLAGK